MFFSTKDSSRLEFTNLTDVSDDFIFLEEKEVKNILSNPNKSFKIVACAREAIAGNVLVLTGDLHVVEIKSRYLPEGRVFPRSSGDSVYFCDADKEYDSYHLVSGAYLLD